MARLPHFGRRRNRVVFGVLLALLLAQSARAQNTGLLLGIDGDKGTRTLWITRESSGRVAVTGELRRLLVPRPDGFWWLDVDRRCAIMDRQDGDKQLFIEKNGTLVRAKVNGKPLPLNPNYRDCDAFGQRILKRDWSSRDQEFLYCWISTIELTHVSSRYISYRQHSQSTEFCNAAKHSQSTDLHVEDFNPENPEYPKRIKLLDELTQTERTSLIETWERGKGDCALEDSPDESWSIAPIEGEWRATFATSGAIACSGDSGGDVSAVTVRVPPSIVKQDSVEPWAAELRRRLEYVEIGFVSPQRDWLIASDGSRLLAFAPSASALGDPVLSLKLGESERVVMGEWAVGTHARRWAAEVARLQSAQKRRSKR